ncbi:MAG: tetratricopeptide repeat protein [Candidatus Binatia bacterium]
MRLTGFFIGCRGKWFGSLRFGTAPKSPKIRTRPADTALKRRMVTTNPRHYGVAISLNNLAEVYRFQAKFASAEPLYKRAIAIQKKAFGSEHPNVATTLNNLAALYSAHARYDDAESLLKRALAITEQMGRDNPELAVS